MQMLRSLLPPLLLLLLLPHAGGTPAFALRRRSPTPVAESPAWQSAVDPASGRTYYWNTGTRETTWVRPAEMDAPASTTGAESDADPVAEQPRITWKEPSPGMASQLATRTRAAVSGGLSAMGDLRTRLVSDITPRGFRPGAALTKGLYLGGLLAAASAVL